MQPQTWFAQLVRAADRGRATQQQLARRVSDRVKKLGQPTLESDRRVRALPYNPNARAFLARLRSEVESHPGVNHPLLGRVAHIPFTREDYLVFGLQHYPLVGTFTTYLELLLLRAPDTDAKQWIAKVLVDEYGEGSDGKDHAALYLEFLQACGLHPEQEAQTTLHKSVTDFIAEHLRICRDEPFLVGLGAVGPGHEWAIPKMFPQIVRGLRRAGFAEQEILYFTLHMEQDEDHGAWLEEALVVYADCPQAQEQIYRGTMLSLEARTRFWSGVQDKIVRWRQPANVHLRSQSRKGGHREAGEMTLPQWRSKLRAAPMTATPRASGR